MSLSEKIENAEISNDLFGDMTEEEKQFNRIMAHISMRIAQARDELGMSQKEFAEFMNVTQGMVSRWECAACNFTFEKAVSIFCKLGISLDVSFAVKAKENKSMGPQDRITKLADYYCKSKNSWSGISGRSDPKKIRVG
jgi:transcriptional regulator with XRE-family HTH domain